jgi:succinate-semialdehyde dehydrogenase/glutarate-semialdehyde dehydrogenase
MQTETRLNYDLQSYPTPRQFIGGEWRRGGDGSAGWVQNPADKSVLGEIPAASAADLDDALTAAREAADSWRRTSAVERGAILTGAARLLRERVEVLARWMTLEQGKPLSESRLEVMLCAEVLDWYANEGLRAYGRIIPARLPGARQMVLPQPLGPVAGFTSWNFPGILPARKIGPALAAGCTMVMKPAEETPASAMALAAALSEAGLPHGVLNLVFGNPVAISKHLILSDVIRKVTFTGSVPIGKELARLAANGVKPCTLELGGHAPALIFDDADLEKTVSTLFAGKMRNAGQVCTSPTRFLVQSGIHDKFVDRFASALKVVNPGSGLSPGAQMGPLANGRRLAAIESLVAQAVASGAKVISGGTRGELTGHFFRPTLLVDTPLHAEAMNTEPFGPIAMVSRFTSPEEAIAEANRLPYGLAAYVFTRSSAIAVLAQDELQAGGIGINSCSVSQIEAPFGGIKDSGTGYEGGSEGLMAYMHQKYIHHAN